MDSPEWGPSHHDSQYSSLGLGQEQKWGFITTTSTIAAVPSSGILDLIYFDAFFGDARCNDLVPTWST
jgi:hypothetical protein